MAEIIFVQTSIKGKMHTIRVDNIDIGVQETKCGIKKDVGKKGYAFPMQTYLSNAQSHKECGLYLKNHLCKTCKRRMGHSFETTTICLGVTTEITWHKDEFGRWQESISVRTGEGARK